MDVAVLLTCHERREMTLACLASLRAQRDLGDVVLHPVVVDSASRDGTAAAVRELYPEAVVIEVSEDVFWAGGMRIAALAALERFPGAPHLWLNDDVVLFEDAVGRLLDAWGRTGERALVAGTVQDPATGDVTYGGLRRASKRRWLSNPMYFEKVVPSAEMQSADVTNGNVLLVTPAAVALLGPPTPYGHAMADYDYSFRAIKQGIDVVVAPGTYGTCARSGRRPAGPIWGRRRLPPLDYWRLYKVQGAPFWPLFWFLTYLRAAKRWITRTAKRWITRRKSRTRLG